MFIRGLVTDYYAYVTVAAAYETRNVQRLHFESGQTLFWAIRAESMFIFHSAPLGRFATRNEQFRKENENFFTKNSGDEVATFAEWETASRA